MTREEHISRIEKVCAEFFCNLTAATRREVRNVFEAYFDEFAVRENCVDARVVSNMAVVIEAIDHNLMYMHDPEKEAALDLYNYLIDTAAGWDDEGFQKAFDAVCPR